MSQHARNDPDSEANQAATRDSERAVFAAKMQAQQAAEDANSNLLAREAEGRAGRDRAIPDDFIL